MRLLIIFFLLFHITSFSQEFKSAEPLPENKDNVYINMNLLDELTDKAAYGDKELLDDKKIQEFINMDKSLLPVYSDDEFKRQMSLIPTTIQLTYNKEVAIFIHKFLFDKRAYVTRMLTHSQYYFPIFEAELDKRNLPQELKCLPIVESALIANNRSRVGAKGLWQIMPGTGRMLGLDINTLVDERSDPDLSTEAGAAYLARLYTLFNDWPLALAAYNSGPGRVSAAIKRSGGITDFWKLKRFLPTETQNYVPSFIAMVYVMHYHKKYFLYPTKPQIDLHKTIKYNVKEKVSLKYVSELISCDENLLEYLNPSLIKNIIPLTETGYDLNIPLDKETDIIAKSSMFINDPYIKKPNYNTEEPEEAVSEEPEPMETIRFKIVQHKETHKVKRGENLQDIARRYSCTVNELRKWNKMGRKEKLKSGEKLTVYRDVKVAIKQKNDEVESKPTRTIVQEEVAEEPEETAKNDTRLVVEYHKVKKGETMIALTRKYDCTIDEIKKWNNLHSTDLKLGMNIKVKNDKVSTKSTASKSKSTNHNSDTYLYYTVKTGETLYSIANKYEVSVDEILRLNKFEKGTGINIGDKIKIPQD
jgi:membrane-bound lytic murein transglycosylase D